AHADETLVADRAAVQHDVVADHAVVADHKRKARIGVQGGIVLNLASLAELDPLVVAAQHGAEPDAGMALEPHPPDQHSRVGHPIAAARRKLWLLAVELIDRHARAPRCGSATLPWRPRVDEPRSSSTFPARASQLAKSHARVRLRDDRLPD